ncbi:hypothetical protein ACFFRR_001955 [Megaselia abdita]
MLGGIFAILLAFVLFVREQWSYLELSFRIPRVKGIPFIGVITNLKFLKDSLTTLDTFIRKLGDLVFFWVGPFPVVLISNADLAEKVLTSKNCLDKPFTYLAIAKNTGDGLFTLSANKWHEHRKLLNPSFYQKVLKNFIPIFNEGANYIVCQLAEDSTDISHLIFKTSLNIAAETTMGKKMSIEGSTDLLPHYKKALTTISDTTTKPWIYLNSKVIQSNRKIKQFTRNSIKEKQLEMKESELKSNSEVSWKNSIFINQVLDLVQKKKLSESEAEIEALVMVFGAFETTASVLYSALICLAMYQDCQEILFDEITSVVGNEDDITFEHLTEMPYMDMVISEVLRLLPAVPYVGRKVSEDTDFDRFVAPKGLQFLISIYHIHRSEEYWGPSPETFDPENFLPHRVAERHPFAYIPFTKGARNCIGRQYALFSLKIMLAKIIRKYKFSTTWKLSDLQFKMAVTLKLKEMPDLKVIPR